MRAQTTGSFAVFARHDGCDVTPRSRKARALLAYLIADPGTRVPKRRIIGLLWGDRGDSQARSSLRQTLFELRNTVNRRSEFICSDRDHIWLRPDTLVEEPPDELHGYKDAFEDLDGISPEFDEWLAEERHRRCKQRVHCLKEQARALLHAGRVAESLELIDRVEIIDPHDEDTLRLCMEAEFAQGHPAAIAERFNAAAAALKADLGVEPSREMVALRDHLIRRLTAKQQSEQQEQSDREYFARRAQEERRAAEEAGSHASRIIHQAIADRYEQIADAQDVGDAPSAAASGQSWEAGS